MVQCPHLLCKTTLPQSHMIEHVEQCHSFATMHDEISYSAFYDFSSILFDRSYHPDSDSDPPRDEPAAPRTLERLHIPAPTERLQRFLGGGRGGDEPIDYSVSELFGLDRGPGILLKAGEAIVWFKIFVACGPRTCHNLSSEWTPGTQKILVYAVTLSPLRRSFRYRVDMFTSGLGEMALKMVTRGRATDLVSFSNGTELGHAALPYSILSDFQWTPYYDLHFRVALREDEDDEDAVGDADVPPASSGGPSSWPHRYLGVYF